ncbi:MAG: S9 family peptidase [Acidobacteriota bacterium]|nr:S9 family peptidase [Acidobacteriota bacterium]
MQRLSRGFSRSGLAAAAACVCFALLAPAAGKAAGRKLSIEDLTAEPPIAGRALTGLAWRPHAAEFSYVIRKTGEDEKAISELWIEDEKGGRRLLLGAPALQLPAEPRSGEAAPGVEKQPQPARGRQLPLEGYRWSPDGQAVLLSGDHDLWIFRVAAGRLDRVTRGPEDEEFPAFSPDGRRVAFVRKNDLYALELSTGRETRLTSDGNERVFNGKLDWVYEEELASRRGSAYEWSPDSLSIAYLRLDDSPIVETPLVDFLAVPAKVTWQRYPKAGAPNPLPSFHIVRVDGTPGPRVEIERDGYVVPGFSWTRDSRAVCYRTLPRAQNREDVRLLDASAGTSRVLFSEQDPAWVNTFEAPRFLADGRYVWKSERSGFAHLYVGNVNGGDLRPITRGEWMVDQVVGVDARRGLVYFTATEENVRRRPLYRVGLEGKGFAKLTQSPGTHSGDLSQDGRRMLDTFSTLTAPPTVSVLDVSGDSSRELVVERPENRLAEYELATTEEVEVAADDGVKLQARLVKPAGFDPARKYPVVVFVYGGPHAQVVRDQWGATQLLDHLLASRGYLVWSLDNRGSWGRGHAWEATLLRETGKRELADQLAGVRHLKSLPFVDRARIGIWGWSYGGYITLYALTNAPDVWKCGIAGAPVTHWKFYDSTYTERYMRTPAENPAGYEASAPLSKAKNLKARLLLIHGAADDNVHLQNTLAFIDALTKAGRPYELQVQPGQKHGFRGKASLDFRNAAIVKFLEENL